VVGAQPLVGVVGTVDASRAIGCEQQDMGTPQTSLAADFCSKPVSRLDSKSHHLALCQVRNRERSRLTYAERYIAADLCGWGAPRATR